MGGGGEQQFVHSVTLLRQAVEQSTLPPAGEAKVKSAVLLAQSLAWFNKAVDGAFLHSIVCARLE